MSKKKIYEEYIKPVVEEIPVATEEMKVESEVLEEEKTEENKPAVYTVSKAGTVANCFRLNIRKRPSLEAEIVAVLSKDDDVEILDESTCNGWLPVLLSDGTKGYTMVQYIN